MELSKIDMVTNLIDLKIRIFKERQFFSSVINFKLIQGGCFCGCSRIGEGWKKYPVPKICHRYSTIIKLGTVIPYLEKMQKIYKSCDTASEFLLTLAFFYQESSICHIEKYGYRMNFDIYIDIDWMFSKKWLQIFSKTGNSRPT